MNTALTLFFKKNYKNFSFALDKLLIVVYNVHVKGMSVLL